MKLKYWQIATRCLYLAARNERYGIGVSPTLMIRRLVKYEENYDCKYWRNDNPQIT